MSPPSACDAMSSEAESSSLAAHVGRRIVTVTVR
jgi:hypothetical protein